MKARLGLVLVAVFTLVACGVHAQTTPAGSPKVLAKIGSFNVTPKYLDYVIENRFAREIMDEIVRTRVVEDEAAAQGVVVAHEAVSAALAKERSAFASDEDFLAHVEGMGFTPKGYREKVRTQLLLSALMDKANVVTDTDARAYYEGHKADFSATVELHIQDIMAATQEDALLAYRSVAEGTPFEVAARRYSVDPPLAKDGDLGWVTEAKAPAKGLWEVAAALKKGEVSTPFEAEGKFHVIRVADQRTAGDFEAVKEQIKANLKPEKGMSEEEFVTGLIARAKIDVSWAPARSLSDEYASLKGIRVYVDDRLLRLKPASYVGSDGTMLVPAKPVLQAIEAALTWRPGTKTMEIKRGTTTVSVALGQKLIIVNGAEKEMKGAAELKDNALFIPPREVLTALGVKVSWSPAVKRLSISTAAVP